MEDTAPGPGKKNTLFEGVPTRVWQQQRNAQAMVQEHQRLMEWIDKLLDARTDPFGVNFDGEHHTMHRTAEEGFFKIIHRLHPDLVRPDQQRDVELVFSLEDLYLLGFFDASQNIWRFFEDARLEGSGYLDAEHVGDWERMENIEGGYSGDAFTGVDVGLDGLTWTHNALTSFSQRMENGNRDEIIKALQRIMFVICEAKRFPHWLERVLHIFATNGQTMVDNFFGTLFQNWSATSKIVLAGPTEFKPTFRYVTYSDAFEAITVLRNRIKPKQSTMVDEKEIQSKNLLMKKMPFLEDYDLPDDEDEHEAAMEEKERRVPRRRAVRTKSPPKRMMGRVPPRRGQPQRNAKQCYGFLSVIFVVLVIFIWSVWF